MRTFDKYYHFDSTLDNNHKISSHKIIPIHDDHEMIIIDHILTKKECEDAIDKSQKYYSSVDREFKKDERDAYRALIMSNQLANTLWNRIEHVIDNTTVNKKLKPFGFGTEGEWKPSGINPCFRYSYYDAPSIGFAPHRDSCYIKD